MDEIEDTEIVEEKLRRPEDLPPRKYEVVYFSLLMVVYFHLASTYGVYVLFTKAKWQTMAHAYFFMILSLLGITVGAHRLWAHRSFKARLPLEIFLMLCHCSAFQFTVQTWVRYHRIHHKYSDTDADPHNAKRGLFFSHIGWVLVRKHPDVKKAEPTVYMEDIKSNPVLNFQKRHFKWLLPTVAFIIPSVIPLLWGEDLLTSWHINQLRFIINLHLTFLVNSVSHTWGYRPYDGRFKAAQSLPIILLTFGEGFHNFHHAFPYDYRSAEVGNYRVNFLALFVEMCAKLGLAYDLKEASEDHIKKRMERTGDGSDLWCRNKDGF